MQVRAIAAADSADLRRAVLRGGRDVPLPGDEAPAFHVGVLDEGPDGSRLAATGNARREDADWAPGVVAWRVRGMATDPAYRGRGAGSLVLTALVDHARAEGAALVWCNARTGAVGFYERHGWSTRGAAWVDPEIGPHVRMCIGL